MKSENAKAIKDILDKIEGIKRALKLMDDHGVIVRVGSHHNNVQVSTTWDFMEVIKRNLAATMKMELAGLERELAAL